MFESASSLHEGAHFGSSFNRSRHTPQPDNPAGRCPVASRSSDWLRISSPLSDRETEMFAGNSFSFSAGCAGEPLLRVFFRLGNSLDVGRSATCTRSVLLSLRWQHQNGLYVEVFHKPDEKLCFSLKNDLSEA